MLHRGGVKIGPITGGAAAERAQAAAAAADGSAGGGGAVAFNGIASSDGTEVSVDRLSRDAALVEHIERAGAKNPERAAAALAEQEFDTFEDLLNFDQGGLYDMLMKECDLKAKSANAVVKYCALFNPTAAAVAAAEGATGVPATDVVAHSAGAGTSDSPLPRRPLNLRPVAGALNPPGHWSFFASHTQRDPEGKLLAAELRGDLEKAGTSLWLDVKMTNKSVAAMREGVLGSDVFLAIISEQYFTREYCIKELRWAREAGKAIQPIVRIEDKGRISEFLAMAPEDLKDLGSVDFISMIREDPAFWDLSVQKVLEASPFMLPPYTRPRSPAPAAAAVETRGVADSFGDDVPVSLLPQAYACIAIQPPPVVIGLSDSHDLLWRRLKFIENGLRGAKGAEWRREHRVPVLLRSTETSELFPTLRNRHIRVLVWCAMGFGWVNDGSSNGAAARSTRERTGAPLQMPQQHLDPQRILDHFMAHAARSHPAVVVVCLKFGAQRAAETLARALVGSTIVWIKMDIFEKEPELFFDVIMPIVDIAEKATHATEAELRAQIVSRFSKLCDTGILSAAAPGVASWERSSRDCSIDALEVVDNGALFSLETNLDRTTLPKNVSLLACDLEHVQEVVQHLERLATSDSFEDEVTKILRIRGGDSKRCRAVAMEACRAIAVRSGTSFTHVIRSQTAGDARVQGSRVVDSSSTAERLLLWVDVKNVSEWQGFLKSPRMRSTTILLTSLNFDNAELLDELSRQNDFEEVSLKAVEVGKDIKSSELHGEFKLLIDAVEENGELRGLSSPPDTLPFAEISRALSSVLPGGQQIAALFVDDDDGGLLVRWSVSSVGNLHELRDMVLQGNLDRRLTGILERYSIRADLSSFARQYERCALLLEQLTPHQQQRLRECEGEANIHVQAPAGAGKTFVALHLMLEILKKEGGGILFVARNPALCLFVANWMKERLSKIVKGTLKRNEMMSRVHLLFYPLESGTRPILVDGGRVSFKEGTASEASRAPYSLVVVDEAHHLYRDDETRAIIESFIVQGKTRRMLLSDISQSVLYSIPYPEDMKVVTLEEVVRCSKRVVSGAMAFQVGGDKLLTKCHHESTGPPLKSFLFDVIESGKKFEQYADEVMKAVEHLCEKSFPGLNMGGRLAIVLPDENFKESFRATFEGRLNARYRSRRRTFALVDAEEASQLVSDTERGDDERGTEAILFDTAKAIDGLERLFIIGVGLDAKIPKKEDGEQGLKARSRIYRAMTRAHMMVLLVNELIQGGWLEFLDRLSLDDQDFDREREMELARAREGEAAGAEQWQKLTGLESKGKSLLSNASLSWVAASEYAASAHEETKSAVALGLGTSQEALALGEVLKENRSVILHALKEGLSHVDGLVPDPNHSASGLSDLARSLSSFCGAAKHYSQFSDEVPRVSAMARKVGGMAGAKRKIERSMALVQIAQHNISNSSATRQAILTAREALKSAGVEGVGDCTETKDLESQLERLEADVKPLVEVDTSAPLVKCEVFSPRETLRNAVDHLVNVIEGAGVFGDLLDERTLAERRETNAKTNALLSTRSAIDKFRCDFPDPLEGGTGSDSPQSRKGFAELLYGLQQCSEVAEKAREAGMSDEAAHLQDQYRAMHDYCKDVATTRVKSEVSRASSEALGDLKATLAELYHVNDLCRFLGMGNECAALEEKLTLLRKRLAAQALVKQGVWDPSGNTSTQANAGLEFDPIAQPPPIADRTSQQKGGDVGVVEQEGREAAKGGAAAAEAATSAAGVGPVAADMARYGQMGQKEKDKAVFNAVHYGGSRGYMPADVFSLLDAGANPNGFKFRDGTTALMHASTNGHTEAVRALCKAGADVNYKDGNGLTALLEASKNGHTDAVRALCQAGADVNYEGRGGSTALNLAVNGNHHETAAELRACAQGGGVVATAKAAAGGVTAAAATSPGEDEAADMARYGQMGQKEKDKAVFNAVHYGGSNGCSPADVSSLLDAGANPNGFKFHDGTTALMHASINGHTEAVRALCKAGADVNYKDRVGMTALKCAMKREHPDTAAVLREYGAKGSKK